MGINARILRPLTDSTETSAPIAPAFLVTTVRNAQASLVLQANVLLRARATRPPAPIGPAFFAIAIRFADYDTFAAFANGSDLRAGTTDTSAIIVTTLLPLAVRGTHTCLVLKAHIVFGALPTNAAASIATTLLVFAIGVTGYDVTNPGIADRRNFRAASA